MSIVYFGSPAFAVPTLEHLIHAGEDVVAVVTQPDKRRGRRAQPVPSPVKEVALRHGIATHEPASLNDGEIIESLRAYGAEFFVVVAYGKILSKELLEMPARACINLHASKLPAYRGAAPVAWAIMNGEASTAACTMLMDEGLDTGDVLLCNEIPILPDDTTLSLSEKLSNAGGELMLKTMQGIREGSLTPTPQTGLSSYARMLQKEDGHLSWNRPPRAIDCLIRGLYPWPGAYCYIDGARMKVLEAHPLEQQHDEEPGVITSVAQHSFTVSAMGGVMKVLQIQPENKRAMSVREYLKGHTLKKGMRVL